MKVLIVEPKKKPMVKDIDEGLESLQRIVGGYIEIIYPFDDSVCVVGNEEAKLIGLPLNRALRDETGAIYDVMAGTFIVAGLSEFDLDSLTDEQLEKYSEYYAMPEEFIRCGNKFIVVCAEEE